jgi:hypothetical protein
MRGLLVLFLILQTRANEGHNEAESYLTVLANNTLLISPGEGGTVAIINFTELSSINSELLTVKTELSSTSMELSSLNLQKQQLFAQLTNDLSLALTRLFALEISGAVHIRISMSRHTM